MSLSSDLTAIKNLSDGVKNNKVTRFAYTQNAYNNNDVNGHSDYVYDRDNNIPTADLSVIEVNPTVVDKGFRARASSLTRMLLNHLFGRISYNLNKVNDLFNELLVKVIASMGVANGLATLDANGRIPYSQLPEDAMEYQGEWNAETNTPHLADGTGTRGDTYNVSVAGTQNLGSGDITFFAGDRIVYNENGVWQRLASGTVQSVCDILPDQVTGNVDLSKQSDISKVLNTGFLMRLLNRFVGLNWLRGSGDNASSQVTAIVHSPNIWVASSRDVGCCWSIDGKTWTACVFSDTLIKQCGALVYANNIFVTACSTSGGTGRGASWSADGKNWTKCTGLSATDRVSSVYHIQDLWFAGTSSNLYWSEDGKEFTACSGLNSANRIVYINNLYLAGTFGGAYWSTDGKTWTQGTGFNDKKTVYDIVYREGLYIAVGDSCRWSEDGKTWTKGTGIGTSSVTGVYIGEQAINGLSRGIVYYKGKWLFSSLDGKLYSSTDGKSWTVKANFNANWIVVFASSDRCFVVKATEIAEAEYVYSLLFSIDTETWQQTNLAQVGIDIAYIVQAGGIYLLIANRQIYRSEDTGLTWSKVNGQQADIEYLKLHYIISAYSLVCSSTKGAWYAVSPVEYINGE